MDVETREAIPSPGALRNTVPARLPLCASMLAAMGLLVASIPARSLWIDELYTVQVVAEKTLGRVVAHAVATERRPPLHCLLLHLWTGLLGSDEVVQRAFSIARDVIAQ